MSARVQAAPAENAILSGIVRIEVAGTYLSDVRLLPADADAPVYGKFNRVVANGFQDDHAYLDLDTAKLPNGPLRVRIVAYDVRTGTEPTPPITAMEPRTWHINNASAPAPLSVTDKSAPANGAVVKGIKRLEVRGTGLTNVELLPATGYTPKLGVFNVSADRTHAWLDFDSRALADGDHNVRISAFNVTAGQSGAQEVAVIQPRQWKIRNNNDPAFTIRGLDMAPLHGETVSGPVWIQMFGTNIKNVELLPANGYEPKYASFFVPGTSHAADLLFDPTTLPPGVHEFRIVAFDKPAGDPTAREILVMPARAWNIQY